jgi:UDP-galactopyranose mutase
LYDKVVKDYNKKMWMVDDNKVFTSFGWSTKGDPIKAGKRDAFDSPDVFSGYPIALDGYNSYFDIATKRSKVLLNTSLDECDLKNKKVKIKGQEYKFDYIINTISPDELFQNDIGELKYIGRDIHTVILPMEYCFPDGVYFLYYANKEKYTRIVEYKKFSLHKSNTTLIGIEFPSNNGKFYPMPLTSEQDLAQKYFDRFPEQTFSIGRNGSYRYSVDIDDSIEQALLVAELIKKNQ